MTEVIAEGDYYGMQTFDQALYDHVTAGRVSVEDALGVRHQPPRLQAAARLPGPPRHDDGRRPRRPELAAHERRRGAASGVSSAAA